MRRVAAALGVAALLLGLTACGPYAARSFPLGESEESVPGTWSHDDGATLVFAADGTFGSDTVPSALTTGTGGDGSQCADQLAESSDRVSGTGTWNFVNQRVRIVFDSWNTELLPYGFGSFSGLEYLCDIDGPSYRFDRQD
jgi:hypothetical protein